MAEVIEVEKVKDVDGEVVKEEKKEPIVGMETRVEYGTARQELKQLDGFTVDKGEALLHVDLACGQRKREGFKGIDRSATKAADYVHDLMVFPWPFVDESVFEFNCSHYVEHIPIVLADGSYGLNRFMEEVWRCLMAKGTISIQAPFYMSQECFQDPTHTRGITDRTFMYYNQSTTDGVLDHYMPQCNFEIVSQTKIIDPSFEAKGEQARRWAIEHYWNVVREVQYVLRKVPLIIKEEKV
jgi:predicted SAM-dependent methyltransferase